MAMNKTRRTVYLGLMVGLALGLHIFEAMLPLPHLFPGAKLGLANIVSLYVILNFGVKEAVLISLLRTVLGSLFAGTFLTITFFLSFTGGVASAIVMGLVYLLLKDHVSVIGISILGALTHNVAQILVAAYFVGTFGIIVYLPYLLVFALPTGFFVAVITQQMQRYTKSVV